MKHRRCSGDVDVIVVPRERYTATVDDLRKLLSTIPNDTRVIVIRGGMPERVIRRVRALGDGRIEIVGPSRHLGPNSARAIGLDVATAKYVAFVDNDVETSPGWLDALRLAAVEHDAWVVRPVVLQRIGDTTTVHEAGGTCHLDNDGHVTTLVETHRYLGCPVSDVATLVPEAVEMFEFHAVLFDRARLLALGGLDQEMLTQGEHLDLCLRISNAGGRVWFEPRVQVTYVIPARIEVRDLSFFLGRWARSRNESTRKNFVTKHRVTNTTDLHETWLFAELHRSYAWLPLGRAVATLTRRPIAGGVAKRFDRYVGWLIAEAIVRIAPRWRSGGRAQVLHRS